MRRASAGNAHRGEFAPEGGHEIGRVEIGDLPEGGDHARGGTGELEGLAEAGDALAVVDPADARVTGGIRTTSSVPRRSVPTISRPVRRPSSPGRPAAWSRRLATARTRPQRSKGFCAGFATPRSASASAKVLRRWSGVGSGSERKSSRGCSARQRADLRGLEAGFCRPVAHQHQRRALEVGGHLRDDGLDLVRRPEETRPACGGREPRRLGRAAQGDPVAAWKRRRGSGRGGNPGEIEVEIGVGHDQAGAGSALVGEGVGMAGVTGGGAYSRPLVVKLILCRSRANAPSGSGRADQGISQRSLSGLKIQCGTAPIWSSRGCRTRRERAAMGFWNWAAASASPSWLIRPASPRPTRSPRTPLRPRSRSARLRPGRRRGLDRDRDL